MSAVTVLLRSVWVFIAVAIDNTELSLDVEGGLGCTGATVSHAGGVGAESGGMRVEVGVQALQLCHPLVPFLSGCGHQQHVSTERCNNSPWQPYVTPGTYATVTTRDGNPSYCHLPEISHPSRKVSVLHECDLIVRVWHVCVQCFQHRYPNPIYGRCMYASRQCVCLSDPSHSQAMIK